MKIVIDLRMYGPNFGIGRYNQKLLQELIKIDQQNQYILLFKEKPQDLQLPDNYKIKIVNCHWYGFKEQFVLARVLNKIKPDLVHFPHFNVPIFYRGKFVVTIHDLIMTKFPSRRASTLNKFVFNFKYRAYNQVIRLAVKRAKAIIAVSKFTADDIKDYFHLNKGEAEKIKVIYEGVTTANINGENIDLPDNFFLYVGNAYPHKNLDWFIQTWKIFQQKHSNYHLILVGKKDYFYQKLIKKYSDLKNIIFPGYLSDEKLASYYHQATAYIFPSKYEGFGLPPLEAMAQNLPVLSSSKGPMPEVLQSAAKYFDPGNQQELLTLMEEIITNPSLRNSLVVAGKEQIKKYSWSKMAKETLEVYKGL